jgi:hypothetical protein
MAVALSLISLLPVALLAQRSQPGKTHELGKGNTVSLAIIMQVDRQQASFKMGKDGKQRKDKIKEYEERSGRPLNPGVRNRTNAPLSIRSAEAAARQLNATAFLRGSQPAKPNVNFVGAELIEPGNFGVTPPDVMGDVGSENILSLTNERIRIINKKNIQQVISIGIDNFFTLGLGKPTIVSDPHVRYDRLTGRWFICAISVNENFSNRLLLAVSQSAVVNDSSFFTFFDFTYDAIPGLPAELVAGFFDYPTLGVDARALLIGGNVFNTQGTILLNSISYVIDKKELLNGVLKITAFAGGIFGVLVTPQGVQNDTPEEPYSYFATTDKDFFSVLHVVRVEYGGDGNAKDATVFDIESPTGNIYPVVTKDAPIVLDGLDDRFLAAMIMKNKITKQSTLVTAHQFHMDGNGMPSTTGGRLGVRWYEFDNLAQTPSIKQKGTLVDAKCEQPFTYWNGSLAVNGQGHMLLSASRSSQFTFPEVVISGRLACDPTNYTQPPLQVSTAKGPYDLDRSNIIFRGGERWGDYSQVVVDPTDNMTMWAFGDFGSNSAPDTTFNWAMQVTSIKAPAPPRFRVRREADKIFITSTENSCKGFFDPGSGYDKRLKAQILGPNNVAVKNIMFTDPNNLVLTVNATQLVPGNYIVVVTNPDEQSSFQVLRITGNTTVGARTGLNDKESEVVVKELKIFPSPARQQIIVQIGTGLMANSTLQIVDMAGKTVIQRFAAEKQLNTQLDISRLAPGTYFVQINNSKETYAGKFVVEH